MARRVRTLPPRKKYNDLTGLALGFIKPTQSVSSCEVKRRLNVLLQVFLWPTPRAATADEIGTFYIELGVQKSTRGEHEFDMNEHSRFAIEV